MKHFYESPVSEVLELGLESAVMVISGDNEDYRQGQDIGEDEE